MRRLGGIVTATIRGELSSDDRQRAEAARVSIEPTTLQEFVAAIGQHGESDQPAPHLAPHPAPLPASQSAPESRSIQ